MSKTIWKHNLIPGINRLEMVADAEILDVQIQDGKPVLWELHDGESNYKETREFEIFGTGHEIPDIEESRKYISTFQLPSGLVFHVFENA